MILVHCFFLTASFSCIHNLAFFIMAKQLAADVINAIKMYMDRTMKLLVQTRNASKQNIAANAKNANLFFLVLTPLQIRLMLSDTPIDSSRFITCPLLASSSSDTPIDSLSASIIAPQFPSSNSGSFHIHSSHAFLIKTPHWSYISSANRIKSLSNVSNSTS